MIRSSILGATNLLNVRVNIFHYNRCLDKKVGELDVPQILAVHSNSLIVMY